MVGLGRLRLVDEADIVSERDEAYRRLGKALADVLGLAVADLAPALQPAAVETDGIRLYRLDQVAERLGIGLTSVKALTRKHLQTVHQGRAVMVPSDSLDSYIARLRTEERQRVQGETPTPIDSGKAKRRKMASSANTKRSARSR